MVGIGAINDNYCMTKGVRIDLLKAMDEGTYIRINPPLRAAGKIINLPLITAGTMKLGICREMQVLELRYALAKLSHAQNKPSSRPRR